MLQGLKSLGVRCRSTTSAPATRACRYLKHLPIDTLKIDRSFVRDIGSGDEADDGVLAQAIISLGHSLHLKVIAEGVETDAQLRFLQRHGATRCRASSMASRCRPSTTASCSRRPDER